MGLLDISLRFGGDSVELYLKILKIVVEAFTQKKGPELVNLADTFVRFSALS